MATVAAREEHGASWFMAPTDAAGRINSLGLAHLVEQVKRANCRCLVLDLRGARVIRICDVRLLVQARDLLKGREGRLRVVARAGSEVARLLRQHQLEHFFFLCESLEEAWQGRAPSPGWESATA
jgi:anti-anti-sigma regulatory factor